jgi:hypothetical protein
VLDKQKRGSYQADMNSKEGHAIVRINQNQADRQRDEQ